MRFQLPTSKLQALDRIRSAVSKESLFQVFCGTLKWTERERERAKEEQSATLTCKHARWNCSVSEQERTVRVGEDNFALALLLASMLVVLRLRPQREQRCSEHACGVGVCAED